MRRSIKKISKTAGLMPGALVYVGENKTDKVRITIIDYNEATFQEKEAKSIYRRF